MKRKVKNNVVKVVFKIVGWSILIIGLLFIISKNTRKNYYGHHDSNYKKEIINEDSPKSIETYQKKQQRNYLRDESKGIRTAKESSFSEEDITLLAGLIEAEVGLYSRALKEQVGIVALNRVRSQLFPNNLNEVVYQEVYGVPAYETTPDIPVKPDEENLEIARLLTRIYSSGDEEWTAFCEFRSITSKTVFEANDTVDQTEYSYEVLRVEGEDFCIIFGESKYDTTDDSLPDTD